MLSRSNIIVALTALSGLSSTFLMIKHVGISSGADDYYFSMAVVAYTLIVVMWPFEQYIFFIRNQLSSWSFFVSVFQVLSLWGVIASFSVYWIISLIFELAESKVFPILMLAPLIMALNTVTRLHLNYLKSYDVALFFQLVASITFLTGVFLAKDNTVQIAYAYVVGHAFALLGSIVALGRKEEMYGIRLLSLGHLKPLVYSSIPIRSAGLVYSSMFLFYTTSVIPKFGEGAFALYSYADRASATLNTVCNAPAQQRYTSEVSHAVSLERRDLHGELLKFARGSFPFYLFMGALSAPVIYFGADFIPSVGSGEAQTLTAAFCALFLWRVILLVEFPAATIAARLDARKKIILVNVLFGVLIASLVFFYEFKGLVSALLVLSPVQLLLTVIFWSFWNVESKK